MKRTLSDAEIGLVVRATAEHYNADPATTDFLTDLAVSLRAAIEEGKRAGLKPLEFARRVLAADDGLLAPVVRSIEEMIGERVGCRAGCSACCDYTVSALGIEADRIAARVALMPREARAWVVARIREARERGLTSLSTAERLARRFPCPLLFDGKCSVYDERPLSCRSWFGITPERCASLTTPSPFGLTALIGDCTGLAVDLTSENNQEAGDLIDLLAERLDVG
jgi:Fe-S-cluster containining protein